MKKKYTWHDYEAFKRIIAQTSQSSEEYERRIQELVRKLGL
jgi:hypothetical protein